MKYSYHHKKRIYKRVCQSSIIILFILFSVYLVQYKRSSKTVLEIPLTEQKEAEQKNRTFTFINRSKNAEVLCIVLAGYKPWLYNSVFKRIRLYLPRTIDMCVVSAGRYSDNLSALCEQYDWSYLSTVENNVCLIQNMAIEMHKHATQIFKLDEDIFITKDYFTNMQEAYERAKRGNYTPGILAPMITINGYTSFRILDIFNRLKVYETLFEKPMYATVSSVKLYNDAEVAKFFWGKDDYLPSIDVMNAIVHNNTFVERPCPIRFSIGAIFYERILWKEMGGFEKQEGRCHLGRDEIQIVQHCFIHSKPVMVSENIIVGHFSYSPQTIAMKQYFYDHPEVFSIDGGS